MNDFEVLSKQLIRDEGEIPHAYQDSLGFWTIGVGRLIDKRKGGGLTHEENMYLLKNDIIKHTKAVVDKLPWADHNVIGGVRFSALINMHFQLGDNLWGFKNTLRLMEEGKWEEAASAMLESLWARQTPARARRISQQIKTNEWK